MIDDDSPNQKEEKLGPYHTTMADRLDNAIAKADSVLVRSRPIAKEHA